MAAINRIGGFMDRNRIINILKKLIFRLPKYAWHFCCMVFFYIIGGVLLKVSAKYRDIWIVSERGKEARDNGYHFFKYVRETRPDIKVYYIIDSKSSDRLKVEGLGNIVSYGGFMHHLLFSVSEYKISTHIFGYSPDILCYNRFRKFGMIRGKLIFLQHGIISNDIEWMFYPNTVLDLFVCGAAAEYRAVKQRYGYPDGVVKYLGLCRYDGLLKPHEEKNQIVLMPTWRIDICGGSREGFVNSEYYRAFQSLINNTRLLNFLEENGCELVFYPHYEVQKFLDEFSSVSRMVRMAAFNDYDVQELLMSSKLLVTDFSSVFFDFSYMGKPVVMYQFDVDDYRKQNYAEGYFSYERDGFGEILKNEDDVVDKIISIASSGFGVEPKYAERVNKFFEMRDTDNCKRNFEAVLSLNRP